MQMDRDVSTSIIKEYGIDKVNSNSIKDTIVITYLRESLIYGINTMCRKYGIALPQKPIDLIEIFDNKSAEEFYQLEELATHFFFAGIHLANNEILKGPCEEESLKLLQFYRANVVLLLIDKYFRDYATNLAKTQH